MGIQENRGGVPHVFTASIDTTGRKHDFKQFSKFLQVTTITFPLRLYFSEEDFTANANYIPVPIAADTNPWGWEGPAEVSEVWLKGIGGTAVVTLVAFLRRG